MSFDNTVCVICHCPTDDHIEWKDSSIIVNVCCCKAHHDGLMHANNMKTVMEAAKKVVRLGRLKHLKEKALAEIQSNVDRVEQEMLEAIVD